MDSKHMLTINKKQVTAPVPIQAVGLVAGIAQQFPSNTPKVDVFSPIVTDNGDKILLGQYASMNEEECLVALKAAKTAWNDGRGQLNLNLMFCEKNAINMLIH